MPPCRGVSCLILPTKADPAAPLRLRRGHELPNRFDQLPDGLVVGAGMHFRLEGACVGSVWLAVAGGRKIKSGPSPERNQAMQIRVLIEPIARNGYRAQANEPFAVSAKGTTREEALAKLRAKIESRFKKGAEIVTLEVGAPSNPWIEFAGMFKGDPWIEDWKGSVAEYRKKKDAEPDLP